MPFPLLPIALGILSAGGTLATNAANKKMAREQMAFQERMSSTAAQRSKEDYEKAGLNPALAYERTASSPSGATANIEDATAKGISSAQSTAMFIKQLKQMDATHQLTQRQTASMDAQNSKDMSLAGLAQSQTVSDQINRGFTIASQPHDIRERAARALLEESQQRLSEYQEPGARNTAAFESGIGQLGKTAGFFGGGARTLSEIIKNLGGGINPIRRIRR